MSSAYHEDMQGGDFYSCTKCRQLHTAVTLLPGKEPRYPLKRRLSGPQRECEYFGGETKSLGTCQTSNPELPSHYTD